MYSQIAGNKRRTVLLMFGFFLVVGALAYIFALLYGDSSFFVIAMVFSVGYVLWGYFASSKLALSMNGAKEIQKKDNPRLWRVVENLAITEGMPMPKVYIIQDPALNAFATGRDPKHASVAITTGLLEQLEDTELQGVMAHELGHIKNYDIRVSMIAFALVAIVSILADFLLRAIFFSRNDNKHPYMIILGLVAVVLAPIAATLIQLAISRQREFLADASGALTTRYPEGLARALEKIEKNGSALQKQNSSTAHLFFANPLKKGSLTKFFATHPPTQERISRLRNMEKQL